MRTLQAKHYWIVSFLTDLDQFHNIIWPYIFLPDVIPEILALLFWQFPTYLDKFWHFHVSNVHHIDRTNIKKMFYFFSGNLANLTIVFWVFFLPWNLRVVFHIWYRCHHFRSSTAVKMKHITKWRTILTAVLLAPFCKKHITIWFPA